MALLIECREGAFFCSSFQAENDQISANQDWAIIFQVPLPSHAKVLSKYNNRVQISPAGFSPYLGWRWRICIIYLFIFSSWVKSLKGCYWKWDKGFMVMFLALRSIHHHANNAKTLYTRSYKAWSTCPLPSGLLGWDASSSAAPGEQAVSVLGPVLHLAFKYFCASEAVLLLTLLLNFPLACRGWKESSTTAEHSDEPGTRRPAPQ